MFEIKELTAALTNKNNLKPQAQFVCNKCKQISQLKGSKFIKSKGVKLHIYNQCAEKIT